MIVGIMADTHDRLQMIDKAVRKLNEGGAELVLHAGDYIAGFVVPCFESLKGKLVGVLGNNDGDREMLKKRFSEFGLAMHGNFAEVAADGVRIALLHGTEEELLNSLINTEAYDVVVHGHLHEAKTYRKGRTLVINPGEVCGYLSDKPTVAILDTKTMKVSILPLE